MKQAISGYSTALGILCLALILLPSGRALGQGQSPIVNFVSAGGPDIQDTDYPGSRPGYDKNYSLVAVRYADGTASGELIDRWASGVHSNAQHGWCVPDMPLQDGKPIYNKAEAERAWTKLMALYKTALT